MMKRSGMKRSLKKALKQSLEVAGKFVGRRNPGTLMALSGAVAGVVSLFKAGEAQAGTVIWGNAGTDMNVAANWGGTNPSGNTGQFSTDTSVIPVLSANLSMANLYLAGSANYNVTVGGSAYSGPSPYKLTLTSVSTSHSTASAIYNGGIKVMTFNQDIVLGGAAGSTAEFYQYGNNGSIVLNGVVSSTNNENLMLGFSNSQEIIKFTNTNTYTGDTTILRTSTTATGYGVVVTTALGNSGSAGALGAGSAIIFNGGQLVYQYAAGETTSKTLTLNGTAAGTGTASIETDQTNGGSGLVFSNCSFTGNLAKALTLQGSNTDANAINGTISDSGSSAYATSVTKSGAGTWILGGNNTYTGGVTISGGTLKLGNAGALNSTAGSENAVVFGAATTGTLSLNGNSVVVANLTGSAVGPVVQNANASTAATLTVGNSTSASGTYAGVIQNGSGSAALSLTKAGTGTLTLSGTNTYSGGTQVNAGILKITNASALGSGAVTVNGSNYNNANTNYSYLELSGVTLAKNVTLATGTTSGYRSYLQNSTGTSATMSGAVTVTGINRVDISAGSGAGSLLTVSGGITSSSDFYQLVFRGNSSGSGTITTNAVSVGNTQVIFSNQWTVGVAGNTWGTTTINTGATVTLGIADALPTNTALTLSANTTASVGVLKLSGYNQTVASLAASTNTYVPSIVNGSGTAATLTVNGSTSTTYAGVLGGAGANENNFALTKSGTGTLTLSGANTYTGGTTISQGALSIATTGALPGWNTSGKYSVANGATLAVYNAVDDASIGSMLGTTNFKASSSIGFDTTSGNREYAVNLANTGQGALGLTKLGANTLTLSGANNTYSGGTKISAGTLQLNTNTAAGTGTIYVASPSASTGGLVLANGVTISNNITLEQIGTGGGLSSVAVASGAGNSATLDGGTVTLSTAGTASSWRLDPATGTTLTINDKITGGDANVAIVLFRQNGGTLVLNGANDFLTQTTSGGNAAGIQLDGRNAGSTLKLGNATALGNAANQVTMGGYGSAATLDLNGQTITNTNPLLVFRGGTLANSSNNAATYSGNVAINWNFAIDTTGAITLAGAVSGSNALTKTGAGTLKLLGTNTYSGPITVSGGTLEIGGSGNLGAGAYSSNITNAGTLLYSSSANQTLSGVISNSGNLVKTGSGTLTLSSANTYTGTTAINGGKLSVNGSLGNTAVAVNSGGTLGGTGTIAGSVTVNSGGHLAPGNSPGTLIINNTLTLNSGSVSDFEIASTSSYDQVTGLTGLTYGGTLNVTGTIASAAHTYTLFSLSSGTPSGDFSSVNLAAAPTGYRWHDFDAGAGVDYFNNASGTIQLELANGAAVKLGLVANALSGSLRSDTTDTNDENGNNAVGTIHVTGSNGGFVSEIDGLTNEAGVHDFADGYVQVDNDLSPAPTLVMLWLKDTNTGDGIAKSDVINYLAANAGGAYTVLTSSDAAWQKLAGAYSGFDTIIDFGSVMGTGDAFSWKFEGDFATITVDKVAVVPEPGSLGLLGLGAMALMGSRRREPKKAAGETALSRFYGRRRIA